MVAPIAQLAEATDLKSVQCRFESDWGHQSPYGSIILDQDSGFRGVQWPPVDLNNQSRQRIQIRRAGPSPFLPSFISEQLKTCPTPSLRDPLTLHRCPLDPGRRRLRHRVLSNRQLCLPVEFVVSQGPEVSRGSESCRANKSQNVVPRATGNAPGSVFTRVKYHGCTAPVPPGGV